MTARVPKRRKEERIHGAKPRKVLMKKSGRDPSALQPPRIVEDEEPDFPRGGASLLTSEEVESARAEAEAEFEKESRAGGGKKGKVASKKTAKKRSGHVEDGSLVGDGIAGKLPRFANRITSKNISPRMKLLGVITEVNEKDLVVSLPGGLRGYVGKGELLDNFPETGLKVHKNSSPFSVFHVGQLVSCVVLYVEDDKKDAKRNKRIRLSLRLSALYKGLTLDAVQNGMAFTAQVMSIEDHGYILHFGVSSFAGFLAKSDQGGLEIGIGQLIKGVVKNVDKSRAVVHLNPDNDLVSNCVTTDVKGLSIDLLVPGMMVNARVHATLENGVLLSFLTYFYGTADIFNLQSSFPSATWKDDYKQHKKVSARVLFIDPTTRAVGLTLNYHLVHNKSPPIMVKDGDIFDKSRIVRVDKGIGLLLEIPSSPEPSPAYASIVDAMDENAQKQKKQFKEGNYIRVRILGSRHLEGLAMGILNAAAFEGSIFTHSDAKPGMLVKAKVIVVDNFGAIVQFAGGIKALCPLSHMSELEIVKPAKIFKVGVELLFRILGCKSKRITVTYKKTMVKSKLTVLASYADAVEGLITHGWVSKILQLGCFVKFYNGVQGFVQRSELGLEAGNDANSMYHVGQVVKCRVVSSAPSSKTINLSFVISPRRFSGDSVVKVGGLVSGVVERLTPSSVVVNVKLNGCWTGIIDNEHLADHQAQASLMKSLLKPGYEFGQLLVLDNDVNNLVLSAKFSLVHSVEALPSDIAQVHPSSVIHGFICNIIETGCFVRFLGRLTGFSPKNKAMDGQYDDLSRKFFLGQSVRSHVLDVNKESGRIKLSLKQSSCVSADLSFIKGYFLMEDEIAKLQIYGNKNSDLSWVEAFGIGDMVQGEIQKNNEFGAVVSFKGYDVVGFISQYQSGSILEEGTTIHAVVLDMAKSDGIVDLSLKPEFINKARKRGTKSRPSKKRHYGETGDLELHEVVTAFVEIVKGNYLVLSVPDHNYALGYACTTDYNTQKHSLKKYEPGERVLATVCALPGPDTFGRVLFRLELGGSLSKKAKKWSSYDVGLLVEGEVVAIKTFELTLKFGSRLYGSVHITEVDDDHSVGNPLSNYKIGQLLKARIVMKSQVLWKSGKADKWELSLRPSLLAGGNDDKAELGYECKYSVGQQVKGYVSKVDNEWVWILLSRDVIGRIFVLDSSQEPTELREFENRYNIGQVVEAYVLAINEQKKLLRLTPRNFSVPSHDNSEKTEQKATSSYNCAESISAGDIICGSVKKIYPGVGGMLVQIGPHLHGRVHYTELVDLWVPGPLSEFQEGQFVKCKVLEISRTSDGSLHVDLSLRPSLQGINPPNFLASENHIETAIKRFEKFEDLQPNMPVQGYVKNVAAKGCFVMLSRMIDARILLSNLSDLYIEHPEKEFPIGKLVHGKVLSVDHSAKKVDLTLKTSLIKDSKAMEDAFRILHDGDVISGRIKRIESYGLFIVIDDINVVGLCHISELSDERVDNIDSRYKIGEKVAAKILKVDSVKQRFSLGMKPSYFHDANGCNVNPLNSNNDGGPENCLIQNLFDLRENGVPVGLSVVPTRASVLPLQVSLDDSDDCTSDNDDAVIKDDANAVDATKNISDRRLRRKQKEERELAVSASEERLLQQAAPTTADDFERLVRSSPNSSFVWIKYMAFLLSLDELEKARGIAERALTAINMQEEGEKLNVWVALFNLENEYGNPPEESIRNTFKRALQYADHKKLHLSLLGVYERSQKWELADELMEEMTKKFKNSCKVWLRNVELYLKQGKEGMQLIVDSARSHLPLHKHIKFISHAAIMEFKSGIPDRGRSLFEGVLREYPKRTDLWSIYLDQEIRLGDIEMVRALFERAICLSLRPKKMKFLFKKYLAYEKAHGDNDRVEYVTKKAMEYVENSMA